MNDPKYRFIDVTGHCFKSFQLSAKTENDGERRYRDGVGAMLRASHHDGETFSFGDMLCFKSELLDAGFKWGTDFYVKKINNILGEKT